MKVTVRRIVEGRVEKAMQFEYEPYDILIEIDEQKFRISHEVGTALLQITVDGRLVVQPETANSICLTEVK